MATISEALMMAVVHHTAGRLQAAEQIYRQILAVEPDQADAWHLLGVVAAHTGRPAMAVEHIRRAIPLVGIRLFFTPIWAMCSWTRESSTKRSPATAGRWR